MGAAVTIEMWPISRVLKTVEESADFSCLNTPEDWLRLMALKASDSTFPLLLESMQQCGQLDPICVENGFLGNGHHRLVAAMLLGWDDILVDDSDWFSDASATNCFMVSDSLVSPEDKAAAEWLWDMLSASGGDDE